MRWSGRACSSLKYRASNVPSGSAQARRVELREQGYRPSKTNRYDIGLKKADFITFLNAYERGEAETVG